MHRPPAPHHTFLPLYFNACINLYRLSTAFHGGEGAVRVGRACDELFIPVQRADWKPLAFMVRKAVAPFQLNGALCNLHKTALSSQCFLCFPEAAAWDRPLKYLCWPQNFLPVFFALWFRSLLLVGQSVEISSPKFTHHTFKLLFTTLIEDS